MDDLSTASDDQLLAALADADSEVRVGLLCELSERAARSRSYIRAADLSGQAAQEALVTNDLLTSIHCRYLEGRAWSMAGDLEEALKAYSTGIDLYEEPYDKTPLARALWGAADVHYRADRYQETLEYASRSVDAALSAEALSLAGLSQRLVARALYYLDREEEALEACQVSRQYYRSVSDIYGVLFTDDFAATVLDFLGRYDEAEEMLRRCLTLMQSTGDERDVAHTQVRLAHQLLKRDEAAEALELFKAAQAVWEKSEDHAGLAQGMMNIARSYEALEELEDGLAAARSAAALWDAIGDDEEHYASLTLISRLLHALDRYHEAARTNRQMMSMIGDTEDDELRTTRAWAQLRLADNWYALEEHGLVLDVLDEDPYWRTTANKQVRLWNASLKARSLFALDRHEEALGVAESALAEVNEEDVRAHTAYLYEIRARVSLEQNRPDKQLHVAQATSLLLAFGQTSRATELASNLRPSFSAASSSLGPDEGLQGVGAEPVKADSAVPGIGMYL